MFIVAEAGVFCVCEQWQMWSIRSMRDASVGIPWMESGAAGKAAFMLVSVLGACWGTEELGWKGGSRI